MFQYSFLPLTYSLTFHPSFLCMPIYFCDRGNIIKALRKMRIYLLHPSDHPKPKKYCTSSGSGNKVSKM